MSWTSWQSWKMTQLKVGQKVWSAHSGLWWTHTTPMPIQEYEVKAVSKNGRVSVELSRRTGKPIYNDNKYFATRQEAQDYYHSLYEKEITKHERAIADLRIGMKAVYDVVSCEKREATPCE